MSKTIYITDFWSGAPDVEQEVLRDVGTVEVLGAAHEDELLGRIPNADALLVWHDIKLSEKTTDALERCQTIVRIGVGYDNVPLEAARRKGIVVCNVPDYGVEEVADHALALLLALARNLSFFQTELRAETVRWNVRGPKRTPRLSTQTIGIVGVGRIGTAVALRSKAFGLNVIGNDPFIPDGRGKSLGIRMVDTLDELLALSDIVSIHTPLDETTRGMINAETLARCKTGALLINTARGPICETGAVLAALESGQLGGVGLDVLPTEPPPAGDPLIVAARDPEHVARYRCLLTPHAAFYSEESFEEMRRKAALEVRRVLTGQPPRNPVN